MLWGGAQPQVGQLQQVRHASSLVVVEHADGVINDATLSAITAATQVRIARAFSGGARGPRACPPTAVRWRAV